MRPNGKTLALAAVFITLPLLAVAKNSPSTGSTDTSPAVQSEATQMVPVNAALSRALDAKKDQPGSAIQATLQDSAHLKDGTVLPSGTTLIGKVTQDDMNQQGLSKLALLFDQARLKDGKIIPVKTTIISLYQPSSWDSTGVVEPPGYTWTDQMLQIEQVGVLPGVDLHSQVADDSSGVLVSTKKSDFKLGVGTGIQLAIAGRANGMNSGA